jgi:tRNA pseudouridine55 synthase
VSAAQQGIVVSRPLNGLLVVDKPAGPTSHDVVERCRRIFGQRKVGHAGTLDPSATGVLLVGFGKVTRLLRFLSGLPKRYVGEVVLGVATSTLDADGEVTGTWDMTGVSLEAARLAAASLTGKVVQVPPMVSAKKVGGRRLHELARAGVQVERTSSEVTVYRFDVALAGACEHGPVLSIDVECSSGTYVRVLAADLGKALGGGAHLRHLKRLAVGGFGVSAAVDLDELEASPTEVRLRALLPPAAALPGMEQVSVAGELAASVRHGRVLDLAALGAAGPGPWAVLGDGGELLAVYERSRDGVAKAAVVLAG